MEYTSYDELIEKYRVFEDGEPVRNTCRIRDKYGILDTESLLIVTAVILKANGKEKIMKNEKITEEDMFFLCLHQKSDKRFWIDGNLLEKAKGKEAINAVKEYDRKQMKENLFTVVLGGSMFTLLAVIATLVMMRLIYGKDDIDDIGIVLIWILTATISGIIFTVITGIVSCSEIKKKIQSRKFKIK